MKKETKKTWKNIFYKTNPSVGISLIVLVITIIVVIILAAAVIISLQNNNPMIEANKARINSDVANMQMVFTNTVGKIMAENQDVVQVEGGSLNKVTSGAKSAEGIAKYKIMGKDRSVIVRGNIIFKVGENEGTTYYTGKELPIYSSDTKWYIDRQGSISVNIDGTQYGESEILKDPDTLKDGVTRVGEKVTGSAKEYQDANENIAVIPIDFAIVPGKTDISNGLVISDVVNDTENIGNQFVWVPVENMSTFKREQGYYNGGLQTGETSWDFSDFSEPLNYEGITTIQEEIDEYNKMVASIREYHGFYIGRYEISNDGSDNAQSKKDKEPWVSIKWGNSMTDLNGGMVEKARTMYNETIATKGKVVSTLIYGICFDETIRFIEQNYPNISKNSTGYGNYGTSSVILTGSKEEYALNNIYDIAGNVYEWTMEAHKDSRRVNRGGRYTTSGKTYPISVRACSTPTSSAPYIGGRIQLYIK